MSLQTRHDELLALGFQFNPAATPAPYTRTRITNRGVTFEHARLWVSPTTGFVGVSIKTDNTPFKENRP